MPRVQHNGIARSGKKNYRVFGEHKSKLNGQGDPETIRLTLNNGRHVMDGKLERGWSVGSTNIETRVFEEFEDAADRFEELTGEKPPEPDFNLKS